MNSFEARVDALSDEFQSTFTVVPGGIANMFHLDEIPRVLSLVEKHLGVPADKVHLHKTGTMGKLEPYDIYVLLLEDS